MMAKIMTAGAVAAFAVAITSAQQAMPPSPPAAAPAAAQAGPLRTFSSEEMASMRASMPEGPSRDLAIRVCAQCHEPQRAGALRLTRDGWESVVVKMAGLGARATDAEFGLITEYLAENFKGEAAKPINMNTASSIELESVAGLLRK
ncbi:MAG: hypothetical protein ABIQ52_01800, partial [Vicinamibacterales bacterium]